MSYRFVDSFRAGSGWNCSSILVLLESCLSLCAVRIEVIYSSYLEKKTAFEELKAPVNKKESRIDEQYHAYTPTPNTSIQSWDCLPVTILKGAGPYSK